MQNWRTISFVGPDAVKKFFTVEILEGVSGKIGVMVGEWAPHN